MRYGLTQVPLHYNKRTWRVAATYLPDLGTGGAHATKRCLPVRRFKTKPCGDKEGWGRRRREAA